MGFLDDLQLLFGKKKDASGNVVDINTPQQTTSQKKILIVEDDRLLANALELRFKTANFTVLKAENGQVGLDMVIANKPQIILLDLMMPIMDGKTMLRKLREIPEFKYLPVIILTNAGEVENITETKRYDNASAFLVKSNVNPDDILQVVNDICK